MERGRTSVSNARKGGKKVTKSEDEESSNISYIPRYIWFQILLMLSVKELLFCRCVCKLWRDIISELEFAKLYFAKSEVHTLIQPLSSIPVSRILYLVDHQPFSSYVDHFMTKLDTKLYIALHNSDSKVSSEQKHLTNFSARDHKFRVVNSCRGLLCLSEYFKNVPVAVCNPITGEYIDLPTHVDERDPCPVESALGFSPQANQYKVIRMFDDRVYKLRNDPITGTSRWSGSVAKILTLGTRVWRTIGDAPSPHYRLQYATYLNGAIHWLYSDIRRPDYIVSFDFVNEKFQPIPPPHYDTDMLDSPSSGNITLGELRGCLCVCVPSALEISVLVMKDYGVRGSWTKEFRLTACASFGMWSRDTYRPMCISSNGRLLLLRHSHKALYSFEPNGEGFKFLKLSFDPNGEGFKFLEQYWLLYEYEAITYTPSFISLKDAIVGEDIEVLKINSRLAGLTLPGEPIAFTLEGKDVSSDKLIFQSDDDSE